MFVFNKGGPTLKVVLNVGMFGSLFIIKGFICFFACVCVCVLAHLCNPDLVRQRGLERGLTRPPVTYYYSFSCCSKYWFIKGFSIWALWHLVKYHQVCRSEERDKEGRRGTGRVPRDSGLPPPPPRHKRTHAHTHPPMHSFLMLIYLFNSKYLALLSVWSHWVEHELIFSALNYRVLLFIVALSDPLIPVLMCSRISVLAHSRAPHSGPGI